MGLASAFIDCATNLWAFELFANNINTHVLIVHFCYSIGSTISPLIIKPFLSNLPRNETHYPDNKEIREATHIQTPFFICGSFFVIASFLTALCYIIKVFRLLLSIIFKINSFSLIGNIFSAIHTAKTIC